MQLAPSIRLSIRFYCLLNRVTFGLYLLHVYHTEGQVRKSTFRAFVVHLFILGVCVYVGSVWLLLSQSLYEPHQQNVCQRQGTSSQTCILMGPSCTEIPVIPEISKLS